MGNHLRHASANAERSSAPTPTSPTSTARQAALLRRDTRPPGRSSSAPPQPGNMAPRNAAILAA
eukprot:11197840-Heterocapsa_arctica.AAC.1